MADSKLIAVMGPTGSGKTTFINLVSGSKLRVGYGLESCTSEIELAQFELGGQLITLIDTPGFDDTQRTQADILKEVVAFLKASYQSGRKLAGVIYFHRISDFRMSGIARENFRLFRKICGDDAMKNVVIVTNMWGEVSPEMGSERETELASKPLFFKDAVSNGARLVRNYNTLESAHAILHSLMGNLPEPLLMQRELVDEHMALPQTAAGSELQVDLEAAERRHRDELLALREEFQDISARKDAAYAQELDEIRSTCAKLQEKLTGIEHEKVEIVEKDREEHQAKMSHLLDMIAQREAEMEATKRVYEEKLTGMKAQIETVEQKAQAKEEQARLKLQELAEAHARREAQARQEADERRREEEQRREEARRLAEAYEDAARQEATRREQAQRAAEALQEQLKREAARRDLEILSLKQQHEGKLQEVQGRIQALQGEATEWQEKAERELRESQMRQEEEARRAEEIRRELARRESEKQDEARREEARWAEQQREEARRETAQREDAMKALQRKHEEELEAMQLRLEAFEREARTKEQKAQQEADTKRRAETQRLEETRRAEEARRDEEKRRMQSIVENIRWGRDADQQRSTEERRPVEGQRHEIPPPSLFTLVRNIVRVFM